MSARSMVVTLALVLAAPPVADAQRSHGSRRGGGESGARSGGGSAARHRGSRPATTAERRHPRAGTGTGYYRARSYRGYSHAYSPYYRYPRYYYGSYWGNPYYYAPFWGAYAYGWPYSGVSVRYASDFRGGALRLIIEPVETQVYVDGYYAGVVGDFDGLFQRLRLEPGRHELRLELAGYQTQTLRVAVQPGQTLKVRHSMVAGEGEPAIEELPGYAEAAPPPAPRPAPAARASRPESSPAWDGGAPGWVTAIPRDAARVRLDVAPADASVYVDGQFRGVAGEVGTLALSPGRHSIEIVRPGHRTFEEDVEVQPREERRLSVRLDPVV